MGYTEYHKNILKDLEDCNHPMIITALTYIENFEEAINTVINDGDWEKYVRSITEYDKFLWECHNLHPQKTNPINVIQNKKYSSYRETLTLPLWVRISKQLEFNTIPLINKSVVQTIYDDGTANMKDVDGGLGFMCEFKGVNIMLPVLTNEDKFGHYCKTQAMNVNGICNNFKNLNNNVINMCTTDNHISIGKKVESSIIENVDILASIRKNNLNHHVFNDLNFNVLDTIEKTLVRELNKRGSESFNLENYKITKKTNKLIRNTIDSEGICLNF
jgi:hypothetical protein